MEIATVEGLSHQVEVDLIRTCATTVMSEGRRAKLRWLLGQCRDWAYVNEVCQAQGVSSLVGFNLEVCGADPVPRDIRDIFQSRLKANASRNLFLTQELLALLQEFRRGGIEAIPFKGPLLAITAYGNVALREFLDLDILVKKSDLGRARALLAKRGYQPSAGQLTESYLTAQLGCDFLRSDGRVALELHWSLLQKWLGFHVDLKSIWAAQRRVMIGQVPVLVLPSDITVLYLCAHGAKHCWNRLCWVVDVAEALRAQPDLKWEKLLSVAESSGCRRTFFIGIHLAKNLLGAPVPEHVRVRLMQDKLAVSLAHRLGEHMFVLPNHRSRTRLGWDRDRFHILTKERWREKCAYFLQMVRCAVQPSAKDRRWIRLPRWLNWLYLVLRPIRVTWQSIPVIPPGGPVYRVTK
jgi:hypothetical protein